jgi:hypothetical protein
MQQTLRGFGEKCTAVATCDDGGISMHLGHRVAGTMLAGLLLSLGCSDSRALGPPPTLFNPCGPEPSVSNFNLMVFGETDTTIGYTRFHGAVGTRESPNRYQVLATEGSCHLRALPELNCAPPCTGGLVCGTGNQCAAHPDFVSVGTVTLDGLGAPVEISPMGEVPVISYDQPVLDVPYPPADPGAPITLQTGGGDYAPFALTGRGIPPLKLTVPDLVVARGQPLSLTWTAPDAPGAARIKADLSVGPAAAPHAQIKCDLPDTGSAQIPASLIDQLFSLGVGEFSVITAARVTIDSTTIEPGCVEFWVSSPISQVGNIGCVSDTDCAPSQVCLSSHICG